MSTPQPPRDDDVEARFRAIMDVEFGRPLEGGTGDEVPAPAARPGDGRATDEPFNLTTAMDSVTPDPPEDDFVPPEPEPVRRPNTQVSIGAVLLGVALACVVADLAGVVLSRTMVAVAIASFVGGLVTLFLALPRQPRDPWDDGSRV